MEAFAQIARDATAEIAGDLELRLEAQAKVLARLDAAAKQAAAGGAGPDDCVAQALASLGDLAVLKREITARYAPRLRRRRLLRWLCNASTLLAPLLALLLAWYGLASTDRLGHQTSRYVEPPIAVWYRARCRAAHPALFSPACDVGPGRELWRAHPREMVYLGNYLIWLARMGWDARDREALASFAALRRRDPGNAQGCYLQARYELTRSMAIQATFAPQTLDPIFLDGAIRTVRDRALLNHTMGLLRDGMEKPGIHFFSSDIIDARVRCLPPPTRYETFQARQLIAGMYIPPEAGVYVDLLNGAAFYDLTLAREGRVRDALPSLHFWRVLCRQLAHDTGESFFYCDRVAMQGGRLSAAIYREISREDLARREQADADCCASVLARVDTRRPPPRHNGMPCIAREAGRRWMPSSISA